MAFANLSIFEIIMLVCFGFAWPLSILKSYRSKTTQGKSLLFLLVILVGYVAGILHKFYFKRDLVMILYVINFIMVSIDVALYFRNRYLEKTNTANKIDLI